jgi:hypothetical protein
MITFISDIINHRKNYWKTIYALVVRPEFGRDFGTGGWSIREFRQTFFIICFYRLGKIPEHPG